MILNNASIAAVMTYYTVGWNHFATVVSLFTSYYLVHLVKTNFIAFIHETRCYINMNNAINLMELCFISIIITSMFGIILNVVIS